MIVDMIRVADFFILAYFIMLNFFYIILISFSVRGILFTFKELDIGNTLDLLKSKVVPPVSIIIPAYNEGKHVLNSIYSVLNSTCQSLSIIIVNDGSKDNTLAILIDELGLVKRIPIFLKKLNVMGKVKNYYISEKYDNVVVIDKEHTDKSDSLNTAINFCQTPLFITVDADTLVETSAISDILFSVLIKPHAVAMGGSVYVLNGCEYQAGNLIKEKLSWNPLCLVQTFEYLRAFLYARLGFNVFGGALCFAGAFTLFEREVVVDIGGFEVGNVAQDFEIITHLHAYAKQKNYPYKLFYTPAPAVWTNTPSTLRSYCHQRINWQYGTLKSLMKHKYMLFNPKYGMVGLFTYPYFLLGEVFSAFVELLAYLLIPLNYYFGILDLRWLILFIALCWGFVALLTMATTLLSLITFNKYKKLNALIFSFFAVMIEAFGLRQIHMLCRVFGTVKYFLGRIKYVL